MAIQTINEQGVSVVSVGGSLDADGTRQLEETVSGMLDNGQTRILFDFSDLDYINSSGLRILVMAYQKLRSSQGKVGICGVKDYIQEVFEISGYDKIFAMYPDRGQALGEM